MRIFNHKQGCVKLTKDNQGKLSILVGIVILGVVITVFFRFENFQAFVTDNPQATLIVSLMIYAALGMTFIPTSPITLFLAVLIGPLQAALVATLGNTLAAIVEYKIGQTLGDILNFEEKKRKLPFSLGRLPIDSPYVLLFGRLVPGGVRGLSYIAGAYQVPMKLYLVTTIIMSMFSALVIAFGGDKIISLL